MKQLCNNCKNIFSGKFCNECGQKVFLEQDKSFKKLFQEMFHFLTHFEGTLLNSIKTILLHPAKMTKDYCGGIRKKYYKPLSLFLFIVIIYLLFPLAKGLNMEMKYYKTNIIGRGIISQQIEGKIAQLDVSEAVLAENFKIKSEKVSKVFFFILIPLTALVFLLLYPKRKTHFYDFIILSTEVNVFFISIYFLIFPLLVFLIQSIIKSNSFNPENDFFFLFIFFSFTIYIFLLFKNFFAQVWYTNLLKSFAFTLIYFFAVQTFYKFLVFEATIFLVG